MRVHFDLLGWLHTLWGVLGLLTGTALGIIAVGTMVSVGPLTDAPPAFVPSVLLVAMFAALLLGGGAAMLRVGRSLRRRQSGGRHAALILAPLSLVLIPFGTALALYTFWVLLNDDARRAYGRPVRATH